MVKIQVCRAHKHKRKRKKNFVGRIVYVVDVASKIKHGVISVLIGLSPFDGLSTTINTAQASGISSRRLDCENLPHFLHAEFVN